MALVGEAHIIVRAITTQIDKDIQKGFQGASRSGRRAGESMGDAFSHGFKTKGLDNIFSKTSQGLKTMVDGAVNAQKTFGNLARGSQFLGAALTGLIGGISAVISGIVALGSTAVGAVASIAVLGNAIFALGAGMLAAKLALGGIGKAVSALNKGATGGGGGAADTTARIAAAKAVEAAEKSLALVIEQNRERLIDANNSVRDAQLSLNDAIAAGREEIQQLGFDAEDAALAEKKAGLDLEKARLALAGVQDLPPNSRVRQEAELAYQEAELNLRKARDRSADLNKEQDKLARTGVGGTAGVIAATNALAQAEANRARVVRDALRSEADANDNLADAKDSAAKAGTGGGGGAGADPFAGLNQAQIDFAKFIASLKPKFDELKLIAANSFLPPLRQAIELLMGSTFDVVAVGIGQVGSAMGAAAISIAQAINSTQNLSKLATLFTSSQKIIQKFGTTIGSLIGIILSILTATAPMAERFFTFLDEKLAAFDAYLNSTEGNTALVDFFAKSEAAIAQFGRIFGNIFEGIGALVQANFGEGTGGQYLLDWLERATQGLADLDGAARGDGSISQFFFDASVNAQKFLSAIGALVRELGDLGANPALGEAFDILRAGAPIVGEIANKFADALPSAATFVTTLLDVINLLTDSATTQSFFDTLNAVLTPLRDFLSGPVVQAVLDFLAPLQGVTLAIGGITTAAVFAGKVLTGYGVLISGALGSIIKGFNTVGTNASAARLKLIAFTATGGPLSAAFALMATGAKAFGRALAAVFKGPVGVVILVIAALVAAMIYLYKTNDDVKKSFDEIGKVLSDAFGQIATALAPLLDAVLALVPVIVNALLPVILILADVIGILVKALAPLITKLVDALAPILEALIPLLTPIISILLAVLVPAIQLLAEVLGFLVPIIADVITWLVDKLTIAITFITDVIAAFSGDWEGTWNKIKDVVVDILTNVGQFVIDVWTNISNFFTDAFNAYVNLWVTVFTGIFSFVSGIFTNIYNFISGVVNNIVNFVRVGFGGLVSIVSTIFGNISTTINNVWSGILTFFKGVANGVITAFESMVNYIITGINGAIAVVNGLADALKEVSGGSIDINIPKVSKISLPRLAKGGVVLPSNGGSIVNVAEAGKPERIEPLDANGLSNRDKALIEFLTGGIAGGAPIFNITQLPGESTEELAQRIAQILAQRQRRGGSAFA